MNDHDMARRKVLLVYAVPHSGHAQAAHALGEALKRRGIYDVREHHLCIPWPRLGKVGPLIYRFLIRRVPALWGHLHGNRSYVFFVQVAIWLGARLDMMGLRRVIRSWSPDEVIVTHFLPLLLLGDDLSRGRMHLPLFAVPTDFGLHAYWAHPMVSCYFVAAEQAALDLKRAGISADRLQVTGIPFRQGFEHLPSREEAKRKLGLDPSVPMILVMGGSYGFFPFLEVLGHLLHHPWHEPCQWVFLFGGYQEGLRRAERLRDQVPFQRIHLYGFREDVPLCMAAADIALSKAGGITTTELLVTGLPSVIYRPLPGQERMNAQALAEGGAAVSARSVPRAMHLLRHLVKNPSDRLRMATDARKLAHPEAAQNIVQGIFHER